VAPASTVESEPQRYVGYLIRRAQQLHVAIWARVVSAETTSVQYSILAVLDRRGAASQKELCDEIDLDRSTIADLVARMERRGLIERTPDPHDGRRKVVTLTPAGVDERHRLAPLVAEVQFHLTSALTQNDAAELDRILRLILGAEQPRAGTPT
jgi:DNA-binding MarR family transcriptional regulator